MTCPAVIRVTTKTGPPGIGLPPGATGQDGFMVAKDGNTPYNYKLVPPGSVGLPQPLGITDSPTFAGLTLSGLQNAAQGLALVGTNGAIQRISIGSGLAIQSGALVATATGGGSGTVTSVGLAVPTGFDVQGSPVTTNGTLTLVFAAGYSLPTTAKQTQWDATTTSLSNLLASSDPFPVYTTSAEVSEIIAALTHLDVDITGATTQHVRNDSGATMAAGTPYHIVGTVGDTTRVRVIRARADDPTTMPASGILLQELSATGGGADGHGATSGAVTGLNTAGATEGATAWVGLTGGISATRPAQNPQAIGTFGRIHASTGSISVSPSPLLSTVALTGSYSDLSGRPPEIGQADAESGTATAFSLWSSLRARQAVAAWWQGISGATGRLLAAAATASDARATLGLGSAALASTSDFATPSALSTGLAGKADLVGGVVPSSQLPGFVDDVLEFANLAAFPATGEAGKLYVSIATNKVYRWSGSIYIEIDPSPGSTDSVTEGSTNLYFTTARARSAISASAPLGYNPTTGTFSWAATGVSFESTGNRFNLASFAPQDSAPVTPASGVTIFADTSGRFSWLGSNGFTRTFDATGITAPRVWTPPDRSGTIALTEEYSIHVFGLDTDALAVGRVRLIARAWQETTQFVGLPLWELVTAPSGASAVLDIRVNGTSIYSTLPSIAAGSTSSSATPGVFSAAFVSANQTIASGSLVEVWCTQTGVSPNLGQGLRSQWYTRRIG